MINQATIMGRVGKIETKTFSNGNKITNMSIVTSKKIKNAAGEKQDKVTWHNATAYQKVAEIAEKYVAKGDLIYIQGEIENQQYTGKDGQERTRHYIIINTLQMLPKLKQHAAATPNGQVQNNGFQDDEVPW